MVESIRTKVLRDAVEGEMTRLIQAEISIELQRSMNLIVTDPAQINNREQEIAKMQKVVDMQNKVISILERKLEESIKNDEKNATTNVSTTDKHGVRSERTDRANGSEK